MKLPSAFSQLALEDSNIVHSAGGGSSVVDVTTLKQSTPLLLTAPPLPCMLTFDGYYSGHGSEEVQAGCGAQLRMPSGAQ